MDSPLILTCEEELSNHKEQLKQYYDTLSTIESPERESLICVYSELRTMHFGFCIQAKRKLSDFTESPTTSSAASAETAKGLKVSKLEAPSFDRNILNWTQFWEQIARHPTATFAGSGCFRIGFVEQVCDITH